jgi:hypothetical protein
MGRGPAAAHPQLTESLRAEGYGIASASKFIQQLIQHFHFDLNVHQWTFYVNNKAMIQRMETYEQHVRHSKWNLRADTDITNRAYALQANIQIAYRHVKSHQDDNETYDRLLPLEAQINVLADAQATLQHDLMEEPLIQPKGNFSMLVIDDKYITRDSKKGLMQEVGRVPIHSYYQSKYGWSMATFQSINWEAQHKALTTFSESDQ